MAAAFTLPGRRPDHNQSPDGAVLFPEKPCFWKG